MVRATLTVVCLIASLRAQNVFANRGPERTVELSRQVLREIMTIPARRIPETLLADAQGIAIIPDVIKIGFVGGIRRGRGVVLVRDRDGDWGLPQFVILTGGSVGWQAGIQSTDVILVFRTKKSIDGLLSGKFTLGAGASVAAGPLGRSAEAATDATLKAEILSYSRSRGVFAGVAIDGSAIEIDGESHQLFYGSPSNVLPAAVPESAVQLLGELISITGGGEVREALPQAIDDAPAVAPPADLRRRLAGDATKLYGLLDEPWRRHLALPKEIFSGDQPASLDGLRFALERFDGIAADGRYRALSSRPEFQAAHDDLHRYVEQLSAQTAAPLALPPPPVESGPVPAQ